MKLVRSPHVCSADIYRLIGGQIRVVRHSRKLTQEQLGERVKLQRTSITNIEKGRQKLLLHTFIDIAKALAVSPNDLLSPLHSGLEVAGYRAIRGRVPKRLDHAELLTALKAAS